MHQHRHVIGCIQREQPACLLLGFGRSTGTRDDGCGQATQFGLIDNMLAPGIGGIQHVLIELGLHLRELLHQRLVTRLLVLRQRHARQFEIAQRIVQQLALCRIQFGCFIALHLFIGAIQLFVLAQIGVPGAEQGQAGVVRGAQLVGIHHAIQMTHRRPDARQTMLHLFHRRDRVVPGRLRLRQNLRQLRAMLVQQLFERSLNVIGLNLVERWQAGKRQQCVGHGATRC